MEINIDSMEVISMLHSGNLHYNAIIHECRLRVGRRIESPPVVHYFREHNGIAGALEKKGDESVVELLRGMPPIFLYSTQTNHVISFKWVFF